MTEKQEFIYHYIKLNGCLDILNAYFVDQYIKKFKPKYRLNLWGASNCPDLSRQLANMKNNGILERFTIGCGDFPYGMGFPKWVYSYDIKESA